MSHSFAARVAPFVAALSILCGSANSQSPAHLSHGAPFLGHPLTIRIEGAAPSAAIDLLFSPTAGSFDGPYGHLELARGSAQTVATGVALPDGTWSIDFPVPLDAALAEKERHYQALVDDATAPAGRRLSDAIHIRLLGPRMYAGHAGGFDVYNAVDDTVVTHVAFASTTFAGPVFDASYSRGAVMSNPRELLFFDPYFGGVQGTVPFASDCSSTLITDPSHSTLYVLEMGGEAAARIHAVEFSTGVETSYLDLPNPVGGSWCEGSPGVELFVGEVELTGQSSIRRIGMNPLADLGSSIVGDPNTTRGGAPGVLYGGGQVLSSSTSTEPDPPHFVNGAFSRSRVVGSTITTSTMLLGRAVLTDLAMVPDANRLIAGMQLTLPGPFFAMLQTSLSGNRPWIDLPPGYFPPGHLPPVYAISIVADGTTVWIVGRYDVLEFPSYLYRLDFVTNSWTMYPEAWPRSFPCAAGLVRDALDHELWVASLGSPSFGMRPKITVIDELHGTSRRIPLVHDVQALYAVPIP